MLVIWYQLVLKHICENLNQHVYTLLPPPRRLRFVIVCMSVCLLATLRKNFPSDLHEIFGEGWQWVKLLNFGGDPYPDAYRYTGNMCLG